MAFLLYILDGKSKCLKEFINYDGSYLLNVVVEKEENVFPMVASGESVSNIRLE